MSRRSAGSVIPPGVMLHNRTLRDELVEQLRKAWPSDPTSWDEVTKALTQRPTIAARSTGMASPLGADALRVRFDIEDLDRPHARLKAIIRPRVRPALIIQDDDFGDSPMAYWNDRLIAAKPGIRQAISQVGRVEFVGHDRFNWNGTAWLVRPNVVVTNAHVARLFALSDGARWDFRTNVSGVLVAVNVDYRQEYQRSEVKEVRVLRVLHIQENEEPDVAFLEVQPDASRGTGITLATAASSGAEVVTIGYPKYDSSVRDPDDLQQVFDGIYDVKRLSPGVVGNVSNRVLEHDCSTLGGSSGSAVVELASGQALGLHFAGSEGVSNFAVPAPLIQELLSRLSL